MKIALSLFSQINISKNTSIKPASTEESGWQFDIFSLLWATTILFHMANRGIYDTKLIYALLSIAALFVIFKPGNLLGFILLISLQVYDLVNAMPYVPNHLLFEGIVSLTMLQALLYLFYRQKSFHINKSEWLKLFSPVIRLEVIILYFFAVFHKLNSGFFSPEVSCATFMLKEQPLPFFISLTPNLLSLNAYLTIIIEASIPALLLFRKTRHWGILLGLLFHNILSYSNYNGFYDFSSMVFAAYFLFADPQLSSFVFNQWAKIKRVTTSAVVNAKYSILNVLLLVGGILVGLAVIHVLNKRLFSFEEFHLYFFWTIYSLIYIIFFLAFLIKRPGGNKEEAPYSLTLPHWAFYIFPFLVLFNGLVPYLGLKTETSYAMFSNLRTEGGISNHFIVPASLQIFDYQKDLVEIVSSSDPELQELANTNYMMVFFSFKEYVARMRPERIEYIRNGVQKTFALNNPATHEALLIKNSLILRKLIWFRPISKLDPQPCSH